MIISVAWGVSQRISGFGKKHGMTVQWRKAWAAQTADYQIKIIVIICLMTGQSNNTWCRHYSYFLVQQSKLFAALMSGYSITGALKLIELSSVRACLGAAIFLQQAGICRIKYWICTKAWVGSTQWVTCDEGEASMRCHQTSLSRTLIFESCKCYLIDDAEQAATENESQKYERNP